MAEAASTNPDYWEGRKNYLYYQVVRVLATGISKDATAILDVGSSGCPYLEWFPDVPHRTSLDLRKPYEAEGIKSITSNYLKWEVDRHYDLVLCLQVLEHVPDAASFAKKLLASGRIVVASVPYKWKDGSVSSHVHDPVDEAKMLSWFGRQPNYSYVCQEVLSGARRLVCVYDDSPRKWRSLKQRAIIRGEALPAPPKASSRPSKGSGTGARKSAKRPKPPPTLMARARRLAKRVLGRV